MAENPTTQRLIQAGGLSFEELKNAIVKSSAENKSLIESVLADDRVSEEGLADTLAAYARFPRINLATANIDPEAVKLLSAETARKHICIPVRVEGRHVLLAMANPTDYRALQEIEFGIGKPLKVLVCTRTEVLDAIAKFYNTEDSLLAFTENLEEAKDFAVVGPGDDADVDLSDTRSQAELPPVVKVVNLIIQDAIAQRATDIHLEPTLNDVQVRVRVDGVLRPLMQLPKWLTSPVCSRMKILARLDIAERRVPQDGRMKVQLQDRSYDIRVSTLPTLFGEKVVCRVLSSGTDLPTLEHLNLEPDDLKLLVGALMQPQGMILVTGPTGSGKSTTLYACLGHRKTPDVNIVTVEDPVEYQMRGINQVQVNVKAGLTFAPALRSILRQDPDIILVGEMRDLETTEIAFHAAMTGHLVLSTLHTNSAAATLTRLLDLGVDPVLISSSVSLIVAQRLLRKLCDACKEAYDPPAAMLQKLGADATDAVYYKPVGCSKCGNTGFSGRFAVQELMPMNRTVREMISRKASDIDIQETMRQRGMRFLLDRGLEKVHQGVTAVTELFRVLQLEDQEATYYSNRCPSCRAPVESNFAVCPNCLTSLKALCPRCNQQLKLDWKICPYCKSFVDEENAPRLLPEGSSNGGEPSPAAAAEKPAAASKADRAKPHSVVLPMRRSNAAVAESGPEDGAKDGAEMTAPTKIPRILVVDDDPSIRIIVGKALEQLPFPIQIQDVASGQLALEKTSEFHPDLIVLDIMMPEMDGFEVCKRLRSQVETAFIPVMMLTANATEEGRIRGYMAGTDDYLAKPFNVTELNARVTRLLRRAYGIS